jgi:hypothetical protein
MPVARHSASSAFGGKAARTVHAGRVPKRGLKGLTSYGKHAPIPWDNDAFADKGNQFASMTCVIADETQLV